MLTLCTHSFIPISQYRDEILAENPEMMEEYLAEVERMQVAGQEEQDRLLQEMERLEAELASATAADKSSAGGAAAFINSSSNNNSKKADKTTPTSETIAEETTTGGTENEKTTAGADIVDQILDEDDFVQQVLADEESAAAAATAPQPVTTATVLKESVQEMLDKFLPKPTQVLIGKVLMKLKDDGLQFAKFLQRQMNAILGQIAKKIEEKQKGAKENAAKELQ